MGLFRVATAPLSAAWGAGKWAFNKETFRGRLARRGVGMLGPSMLGAGIGGTIGAFRGDVSGEARLGEIFKHAALGAVGGAGLHMGAKAIKPMWRANMRAGRGALLASERAADAAFIGPRLPGGLISRVKEGASSNIFARRVQEFGASPLAAGVTGGAKTLGKGTFKAARFAFEHPIIAGGSALAVGGGIYAAGRGGSTPGYSPTMTGRANIDYNQQAMAADMMSGGIAPMGVMGSAEQFQQYQEYQTYKERLKNSAQGLVQGLHKGRHG